MLLFAVFGCMRFKLLTLLLLLQETCLVTVVWQSPSLLSFEATAAECEARGAAVCRDEALLSPNTWVATVCSYGELRSYYTNHSLQQSFAGCATNVRRMVTSVSGGITLAEEASTQRGACCEVEVTVRTSAAAAMLSPATVGVRATPCQRGYACAGLQAAPTACASGTFAAAEGAASCQACQPGTFSALSAAYQCTTCPPGTYASLWRSDSCTPCVTGTYAVSTRSAPCPICPLGAYCPDPSLGSAQCPAHTYTAERGTVTKLSCLCQDGYACTYVRRVLVTLELSAPVGDDVLKQALAQAAGVSPDKVVIQPHGRRLLHVTAFVMGATRIDKEVVALPVRTLTWEMAHWVTPRPRIVSPLDP